MGVSLLIIMNIITALLCALANQVASQTQDFTPARILARQKTISENSDLYVTCSTFGLKKNTTVYVYLCKEDVGIEKNIQKEDQYDTLFIIPKVNLNNSGKYSCVFSTMHHTLSKINKTNKRKDDTIQILVIANFLPADISVVGPSTVSEGDDVELRCTVSDTLQTLGDCKLIHSYLRRNESILQVQEFNIMRMEATFTIEGAVMRDSGHYSCVVLPSKCIKAHEETLYGNNAVLLEVKDNLFLRVIVSCGVISLMILLILCLWWLNKHGRRIEGKLKDSSDLSNPDAVSQQANTGMLEEQTEGGCLEGQDEESFSIEEEEGNHNVVAAEDSYNDNYEGVYSRIDESDDEYDDIDQMCAN